MTAEPAPAVAEAGHRLGTEKEIERSWLRRLPGILMLPREHGAWAMLLMPYLLGTMAAGWGGWPSLLLLLAILALFSAGRPLELTIQGRRNGALLRLAIYSLAGIVAGLGLLLLYDRWMLLLGVIPGSVLVLQLWLRMRRLDRTWPVRLVSIAALSATGPAAYYAASSALDNTALAVWLLPFAYSGASVFYVRLYYRPLSKGRGSSDLEGRVAAEHQMLGFLAVVLAATAALGVTGVLPPLAIVAFVPLAVKAIIACGRRGSRPALQRLGLEELAHSLLFLVLAAGTIWIWA